MTIDEAILVVKHFIIHEYPELCKQGAFALPREFLEAREILGNDAVTRVFIHYTKKC